MSFVNAVPEHVAAAATDLANIGSTISSANAAALAPTSGVLAAGADEVSASIAALFGAHAQAYQALSAQAELFHQQFVQLMNGGAVQYAITEAANASPLQTAGQGLMAGVNAPSQAQAEHTVTSNSANGVPGIGANGAGGGSGTAGQAGGNGGAGRLVGGTVGARPLIGGTAGSGGIGPAAAAVGNGRAGGWFGAGGVGGAGSSPVGDNLGGVGMTGGYGGLVASGGAGEAAESAEGLGIGASGGTPVAAAPDSEVTAKAAAPAVTPVYPPATAGPAARTPAYSPAPAAPAASAEERPAATAGT